MSGIDADPGHGGRGVKWREQRALCDYLFGISPIERIEAVARTDNTAEQHALVRAGFTREGVLRSARFNDGASRDVTIYARLRNDADQPSQSSHP